LHKSDRPLDERQASMGHWHGGNFKLIMNTGMGAAAGIAKMDNSSSC
jgi:hypothetical protein